MTSKHYPELKDFLDQQEYAPSISFIFPFENKLGHSKELAYKLKTKSVEIEKALTEKYTPEQVKPLVLKLQLMVDNFKPENGHSGLALFLSPVFDKIVYLDFKPQEKLIIDKNFEIRDLLYNKSILNRLILMLLSGNEIRYYLYDHGVLSVINVGVPTHIEAFMDDSLHDVSVYYEKSDRKDKAMHLFMKNADEGLSLALKDYPCPVVVTGSEKIMAHYKLLSSHTQVIGDYIHGNYQEASPAELIALIGRAIHAIRIKTEEELISQLEEALNKKQLACGVKEVWKQVVEKNGRLLAVEKNYRRIAGQGPEDEEIFTLDTDKVPFPIQDAVDDIIEKLIMNGGKVEFVEDDKLVKYRRVALITHYTLQ
ncbi:MAG: hypothetical protein SH818_01520 [Saprospiraceae bacterium]|nr:hypothetical protein [Saprospiraceae bacterium]